jgi:23S rRNA pseudouridine955/2504/2580 synthase
MCYGRAMSERHRQGRQSDGGRTGRRDRQKPRHGSGTGRQEKVKAAGRPFGNPQRGGKAVAKAKPAASARAPSAKNRMQDRPPPRHRQVARESDRHTEPPAAQSASAPAATGVQTVTVTADESGMRIDRYLEAKFPGLSFSHIQRIIRKGELRVNGKRREPKDRLEVGQAVRIPPLRLEAPPPRPGSPKDEETKAFLKSITLYEDDDVMVLNKPMGLAVQGGSGTTRHLDGLLAVLTARDGQRPRLVHRLDKDTAGCLLVAKNRFSAAALAKTFRSRSARKIYWALVPSVPKPKQGRISTYLAKEERDDDSIMRVAKHGEEGASHAVTYYAVVETAANKLAWLSLKPVTGRTHQLRVQLAHIDHPIVGDPKYFNIENWELPGGIQNRLHLLARRIAVPHPRGGTIDVTAPLPPHMQQSWNLLGFDGKRYDPIEDSPED